MPSRFLGEAPRELLIGYYGESQTNDSGSSRTANLGNKNLNKGFEKESFTDDNFSSSVSKYYDEGRGMAARQEARMVADNFKIEFEVDIFISIFNLLK
jgi:hypothetical protein